MVSSAILHVASRLRVTAILPRGPRRHSLKLASVAPDLLLDPTRSWEVPVRSPAAPRRTILRPVPWFVKRVNTTNCASLLGQSQDVEACAILWKRLEGGQIAASHGAQAG